MNLEQIKAAVLAGKTVCWASAAYHVKNHKDQWNIVCQLNQHTIGLTWADGVTMNGKEEEFFILDPTN